MSIQNITVIALSMAWLLLGAFNKVDRNMAIINSTIFIAASLIISRID